MPNSSQNDPCSAVTDAEQEALEQQEKHSIPYEDGALVLNSTGDMYILASNDVRINLYLLAVQKLLSINPLVQKMVAAEIQEMLKEIKDNEKLPIKTEARSDNAGNNSE